MTRVKSEFATIYRITRHPSSSSPCGGEPVQSGRIKMAEKLNAKAKENAIHRHQP